jgi:hypothetical protein
MERICNVPSDLTGLYSIVGAPIERVPQARFISAEETPEPYRGLLAHHDHMTVTMEAHYREPVEVEVLHEARSGECYARKILLRLASNRRVVQFGIMRFHFRFVGDEVRDRILEGDAPLGRILIEAGVLRRISTHALVRIAPNEELCRLFEIAARDGGGKGRPNWVYGRLATIFCNDEPAVDLLEIPAPVEGRAGSPTERRI